MTHLTSVRSREYETRDQRGGMGGGGGGGDFGVTEGK